MTQYTKKPVTIEAFQLNDCHKDHNLPSEAFADMQDMHCWFKKAIDDGIVTLNDDGTATIKTLEGEHLANNDDYIIQGIKGELYPCKPDIFKATYEIGSMEAQPTSAEDQRQALINLANDSFDFGFATTLMKEGFKVAREGWNGKGMFLYHVPENKYPASRNEHGTMIGVFPDDMVPYGAYIAMKTAQNNVVPWLASQTDVLAEDWVFVD